MCENFNTSEQFFSKSNMYLLGIKKIIFLGKNLPYFGSYTYLTNTKYLFEYWADKLISIILLVISIKHFICIVVDVNKSQ